VYIFFLYLTRSVVRLLIGRLVMLVRSALSFVCGALLVLSGKDIMRLISVSNQLKIMIDDSSDQSNELLQIF
jgi:hypothetical protein